MHIQLSDCPSLRIGSLEQHTQEGLPALYWVQADRGSECRDVYIPPTSLRIRCDDGLQDVLDHSDGRNCASAVLQKDYPYFGT